MSAIDGPPYFNELTLSNPACTEISLKTGISNADTSSKYRLLIVKFSSKA